MKQHIKSGIIIFIMILPVFVSFSCKKPSKPNAIITVQDMNDNNISNADVLVYSSPNGSNIRAELTTNEAGQVLYESENNCILNVKASYNYMEGYGLIILKEGETYYETVKVN